LQGECAADFRKAQFIADQKADCTELCLDRRKAVITRNDVLGFFIGKCIVKMGFAVAVYALSCVIKKDNSVVGPFFLAGFALIYTANNMNFMFSGCRSKSFDKRPVKRLCNISMFDCRVSGNKGHECFRKDNKVGFFCFCSGNIGKSFVKVLLFVMAGSQLGSSDFHGFFLAQAKL